MDQEKIGKFISECRKEKGLTQAMLAEKLNISDRAVSKWERGICLMDMSLLKPLSEILGVSVNELLAGEKMEKETKLNDNVIIDTIDKYSKNRTKVLASKIVISIMIILIILPALFLTINHVFKTRHIGWKSLSIMNVANKFCDALENEDYEKVKKLLYINGDPTIPGYLRDTNEYVNSLEELNNKGVKFISRKYDQAYFNLIDYVVVYEIEIEYDGNIGYMLVEFSELNGKINRMHWSYRADRSIPNDDIWKEVSRLFFI